MNEKLFSAIGNLFADAGKSPASAFPCAGAEFNRRYALWLQKQTQKPQALPAYHPLIGVIAQEGVPESALSSLNYPTVQLLREGDAPEGEYLLYLFKGDRLAPDALTHLIAAAGGLYEHADLIYADEDEQNGRERVNPLFKTELNEIDLLSFNSIGRPMLVRCDLHQKAGALRGWNDAAAYAYALRCAALCTRPVHVSKLLLTRASPLKIDAAEGRAAIDEYLKLRSQDGYAVNGGCANTFYVRASARGKEQVCMIVPNKNALASLRRLLESLELNAMFPYYKIMIVDGGTEDLDTLRYYDLLQANKAAEIVRCKSDNTAVRWNYGARRAKSPYLLFLRNNTELYTAGFLAPMMEYARRAGAGAVGCRCVDPQGRPLAEATLPRDLLESVSWMQSAARAVSILRGECMMLREDVFFGCGAFDETLDGAGAAAELCIRLQRRKRTNILLGSVRACVRAEKRVISDKEKMRLYDTLRVFAQGDPHCSGAWNDVWNVENGR